MVRTSPSQGAESSPPPQPSVMESQMAFLYHSPVTNGNSSFCGASLISDIQLVTAAHCVSGKTTDEVAVLIGNPNTEVELNKQNFRFIYKIEIYKSDQETIDDVWKLKQTPNIAVITLK